MLSSSLGLQALLDSDRLKDFQACLRVVVQHCQGLEPALVAELLSCFPAEQFAMAVMGHAVPGGAEQAGPGASGREARHQVRPAAVGSPITCWVGGPPAGMLRLAACCASRVASDQGRIHCVPWAGRTLLLLLYHCHCLARELGSLACLFQLGLLWSQLLPGTGVPA